MNELSNAECQELKFDTKQIQVLTLALVSLTIEALFSNITRNSTRHNILNCIIESSNVPLHSDIIRNLMIYIYIFFNLTIVIHDHILWT